MEILRVETSALVGIGYRAVSHSRYAVRSLGDLERYSGASQGTPVGRYSRRPLRGAPAGRKTLRERRPTRANRRGDADGEEKKRDGRAWAQARCHDKFVVSAAVPSCDGSRGRSLPTTLGPHVRQSGGPKVVGCKLPVAIGQRMLPLRQHQRRSYRPMGRAGTVVSQRLHNSQRPCSPPEWNVERGGWLLQGFAGFTENGLRPPGRVVPSARW